MQVCYPRESKCIIVTVVSTRRALRRHPVSYQSLIMLISWHLFTVYVLREKQTLKSLKQLRQFHFHACTDIKKNMGVFIFIYLSPTPPPPAPAPWVSIQLQFMKPRWQFNVFTPFGKTRFTC